MRAFEHLPAIRVSWGQAAAKGWKGKTPPPCWASPDTLKKKTDINNLTYIQKSKKTPPPCWASPDIRQGGKKKEKEKSLLPVGLHLIYDGRGSSDEIEVILAFKARLSHVHVEEPEEAAAKAEAHSKRILWFVLQRRVIELQLLGTHYQHIGNALATY